MAIFQDIATELKIGLGKDWHLLIDALLPVSSAGDSNSRDSKDKDKDDGGQGGADDEPEDALHNALEVTVWTFFSPSLLRGSS